MRIKKRIHFENFYAAMKIFMKFSFEKIMRNEPFEGIGPCGLKNEVKGDCYSAL